MIKELSIKAINDWIKEGNHVFVFGEEGEGFPHLATRAKAAKYGGKGSIVIEYRAHYEHPEMGGMDEFDDDDDDDDDPSLCANQFNVRDLRKRGNTYVGDDYDGEPIELRFEEKGNVRTKFIMYI